MCLNGIAIYLHAPRTPPGIQIQNGRQQNENKSIV